MLVIAEMLFPWRALMWQQWVLKALVYWKVLLK
jgi:hypothetical protein